MNSRAQSPLNGSVFALAATSAAALTSLLLRPYLDPAFFILFVAAVWLSAWYYGRGGGIVATVASAIAIFYFFLGRIPERLS